MLIVPSATQLTEDQLVASFWDSFAESPLQLTTRATEPTWLHLSISLTPSSETLQRALLSIACIRLGRLYGDRNMILKAQRVYGQALRLMQSALHDDELVQDDSILAAARCMLLYESFEAPSGNVAGWQTQVAGIGRMIEVRGPHRYNDPLSRAILESMRYNIMACCFMHNQDSFLGQIAWMEQPWADQPRDIDQRIFDCGFTLIRLMGIMKSPPSSTPKHNLATGVFEGMLANYTALTSLHQEVLREGRGHRLLYGEVSPEARHGETTFAITLATILGVELIQSIFAAKMLGQFSSDPSKEELEDVVVRVAPYCSESRRLQIARAILNQVRISLRVPLKYMRHRILFPLNVIRWELRNIPEDAAQIREMFMVLSNASHIGFAGTMLTAGRKSLPDWLH
jgi:hypothetical protein